jgi:hypothetical protein
MRGEPVANEPDRPLTLAASVCGYDGGSGIRFHMRTLPAIAGTGPVLVFAAALSAQNPAVYPFGIDQDYLHGAPDFSFLNHHLSAAHSAALERRSPGGECPMLLRH